MEGLTDHVFRSLHHAFFPGLTRYYTPFLSPTADGSFDRKTLQDVLPMSGPASNCPPAELVPQLLTRKSADFLWAARLLGEIGYEEVNLNLGCPSGTVTAKGKGAGMLSNLPALTAFLDDIFQQCPIRISVKTRLGVKSEEEFPALLEIFNQYPICELIVHTRVREDFYRRPAHLDAFADIFEQARLPLCYNGDLTTERAFRAFSARFPHTPAVMLGRGLIADPALFRRCQGGPAADRETLHAFHDALFDAYCSAFRSPRSALSRMKEFWFYHICLFEHGESLMKRLRKTTDPIQYRAIVAQIYDQLSLRTEGARPAW